MPQSTVTKEKSMPRKSGTMTSIGISHESSAALRIRSLELSIKLGRNVSKTEIIEQALIKVGVYVPEDKKSVTTKKIGAPKKTIPSKKAVTPVKKVTVVDKPKVVVKKKVKPKVWNPV